MARVVIQVLVLSLWIVAGCGKKATEPTKDEMAQQEQLESVSRFTAVLEGTEALSGELNRTHFRQVIPNVYVVREKAKYDKTLERFIKLSEWIDLEVETLPEAERNSLESRVAVLQGRLDRLERACASMSLGQSLYNHDENIIELRAVELALETEIRTVCGIALDAPLPGCQQSVSRMILDYQAEDLVRLAKLAHELYLIQAAKHYEFGVTGNTEAQNEIVAQTSAFLPLAELINSEAKTSFTYKIPGTL